MRRRAYLEDQLARDYAQPLMRIILAILRAQYLSYQTSHWQARGPGGYGNHLLFQRLYEGVQEEIDTLGEKMVGYFGESAVDLDVSLDLITDMAGRWREAGDLFDRGLESESELQSALSIFRDTWPKSTPMPLGLDDWLAATANAHESNQYLLQQARDPRRVASGAPSAEGHFYDAPQKRETREFAETDAPTNVPDVGQDFSKEHGNGKVMRLVNKTPPTPSEVLKKQPGSSGASTLSRLVVKSEDPAIRPAEKANAKAMPHMALWLRQIQGR